MVALPPVSTDSSLKMCHFILETVSHESQSGRHSGMKEVHNAHAQNAETCIEEHACLLKFCHLHSTCMGTVQSKGPFYALCVV